MPECIGVLSPEAQVQLIKMKLAHTEQREDIAIKHCIKAIKRNNQLTAKAVHYMCQYWRAAGYPFPMAQSC